MFNFRIVFNSFNKMYRLLGVDTLKKSNKQLDKFPLYSHLWDSRRNRTFSMLSKECRNLNKNNRNQRKYSVIS